MIVTPATLRTLRETAEPIVARVGCELVAVEFMGGPRGPILRVSIDKVGGVGIEECTQVSRQLSPALDVADPILGAYDLEVSTPGIERPVQRAEDFAKFAGCEVRVKPFGVEMKKRTKGILLGITEGMVQVRTPEEVRQIPIEAIERANLVLTLDQFQRLGEGLTPIAEATP